MAFLLGNQIVLDDTESGHLSKLQINGTDVLTLNGSTITLKNVDIADSIEGSINSDNAGVIYEVPKTVGALRRSVPCGSVCIWVTEASISLTSDNTCWQRSRYAEPISVKLNCRVVLLNKRTPSFFSKCMFV